MNIWYFHHYATPYEMAGLHRPFEFGEYFQKNENNVMVFTASYLHYEEKNLINNNDKYIEREYGGIKTIFVRTCGYSNSGMKRVMNMFQFSFELLSIYKEFIKKGNKPDVIIASSPHPFVLYVGIQIGKRLKIPCVCEIRDLWPEVFFYGGRVVENSLLGTALLRGERYLYEKADALVFLKEGDHTYISDHKWDTGNGGRIKMSKCYYINNGVDISLFDKRREQFTFRDKDFENQKFKIVYCGTIRPVNQVDILLDVGKILGDQVEILIFGMGSCLDEMKLRIKNENITNVKLKGYVENKYIPYILSKSDVNILNYSGSAYNWTRGNSSNKLFEYLASGKPVVSTVRMGYDILERYSCGVSAEKCTAENIAYSIEKILKLNREEYVNMCKNARLAAEEFDIPILANKYLDSLKKIKGEYQND